MLPHLPLISAKSFQIKSKIINNISYSLLIIISLKFGVWAAINRDTILKLEQTKLNNYEQSAVKQPIIIPQTLPQTANSVIKYHYIHTYSTNKSNKARTPTANIKIQKRYTNSYAMPALTSSVSIEKIMDNTFFGDLLNFRFGFYCFSQYLHKKRTQSAQSNIV